MFLKLLFRTFVLPSRKRDWKQEDYATKATETAEITEKYKTLVGGPSEPLSPAETKFCPRCHVAVAQLRRTNRGTEIIQHGKVLVTVGNNVLTTKDGKEMRGFPLRCPNGHTVGIE